MKRMQDKPGGPARLAPGEAVIRGTESVAGLEGGMACDLKRRRKHARAESKC